MAGKSEIQWCTHTWNPIVGCSIVSPGCTNCYAMRVAGTRLDREGGPAHYRGTTQPSKAGPVWTGRIALAPETTLLAPLRWRKPATIFVNSMGDLFHESISDEQIDRVFAVMALCPQHTFQVLTKRAERMRAYFEGCANPPFDLPLSKPWLTQWHRRDGVRRAMDGLARWEHRRPTGGVRQLPLPNVWLGVSAERQQEADERIPLLLQTPAAIRFVSLEPLLGPIDLHRATGGFYAPRGYHRVLDWVIVGGESGPNARPMAPEWARSIRDQCALAGVAYFFKQWGEFAPSSGDLDLDGERTEMLRVGKKAAGRLLDGKEHNAMPHTPTTEPIHARPAGGNTDYLAHHPRDG